MFRHSKTNFLIMEASETAQRGNWPSRWWRPRHHDAHDEHSIKYIFDNLVRVRALLGGGYMEAPFLRALARTKELVWKNSVPVLVLATCHLSYNHCADDCYRSNAIVLLHLCQVSARRLKQELTNNEDGASPSVAMAWTFKRTIAPSHDESWISHTVASQYL